MRFTLRIICVRYTGACIPNFLFLALIIAEISAFIRTERPKDLAKLLFLCLLDSRNRLTKYSVLCTTKQIVKPKNHLQIRANS